VDNLDIHNVDNAVI